jgi:hypothetical protein
MKRLVLLFAACSSGAPAPTSTPAASRFTGSLSPPPAQGADVVATVDGERIYVADVETQARAAGQTPAQALDALVEAMVLAAEARRRGLADDPDVVEARRRAEVRALLAGGFEPTFAGPEAIPQDHVNVVYDTMSARGFYEHVEARTVAYARVKVPDGAPAEDDARAHSRALAVYAAAVAAHPTTREEFFAAVTAAGLEASGKVYTTSRDGPAVPEFAAAAFSIPAPGGIAAPVRTLWGWDILYLDAIVPERHTGRAEAEAEIRKNRFPIEREGAFLRWAERLVAGHTVVKNDALLGRVQVDSLVGPP